MLDEGPRRADRGPRRRAREDSQRAHLRGQARACARCATAATWPPAAWSRWAKRWASSPRSRSASPARSSRCVPSTSAVSRGASPSRRRRSSSTPARRPSRVCASVQRSHAARTSSISAQERVPRSSTRAIAFVHASACRTAPSSRCARATMVEPGAVIYRLGSVLGRHPLRQGGRGSLRRPRRST